MQLGNVNVLQTADQESGEYYDIIGPYCNIQIQNNLSCITLNIPKVYIYIYIYDWEIMTSI